MERVELKRVFDQVHLYIDHKPVTALFVGKTEQLTYDCTKGTHSMQEVPQVQVGPPWVNHYMRSSEEGATLFTDEPRDARAETVAWRASMLADLRILLGTNRNCYQPAGYGESAPLNEALRGGANAFGPHFTAFFEILTQWIEARPVGDTRVEFVPLAPGEPPPGVP